MRLISWNIQWCRGRDGRVDAKRIAAVLHAHDADVICLQEVAVNHPGLPGMVGTEIGDQVALLAGLFLGYELAFGPATDLPDGRGGRRLFGNLVISRHPLLQVFRHALPFPADAGRPGMARSALEVVVAVPFGTLRLINTHLEYYSAVQRHAQCEALRSIYAEGWEQAQKPMAALDPDPPFAVFPRGDYALICGDFNAPPAAEESRRLTAAFDSAGGGAAAPAPSLYDAWCAVHGAQDHEPTAGLVASDFFPRPVCLDRAYISENLLPRLHAVLVDAACDASDHQPLILDFADTP